MRKSVWKKPLLFLLSTAVTVFITVLITTATATVYAQESANSENGHQVFDHWCAPCHAPGPKHPGTQALDALYNGVRPGALEERTDLTVELVSTFVRNGVSVMTFFRKTEISDADLEDLGAYLSE